MDEEGVSTKYSSVGKTYYCHLWHSVLRVTFFNHGFEVLTVPDMKITLSWDVMLACECYGAHSIETVWPSMGVWMINWQEFWKNQLWPNWGRVPEFAWRDRQTVRNLSQCVVSWPSLRVLLPRHPVWPDAARSGTQFHHFEGNVCHYLQSRRVNAEGMWVYRYRRLSRGCA
jgi:hypothetical protein